MELKVIILLHSNTIDGLHVNPLHGVERRERIEDQYKRLIERIHYMELKEDVKRTLTMRIDTIRIHYMELKGRTMPGARRRPPGRNRIHYMELKG